MLCNYSATCSAKSGRSSVATCMSCKGSWRGDFVTENLRSALKVVAVQNINVNWRKVDLSIRDERSVVSLHVFTANILHTTGLPIFPMCQCDISLQRPPVVTSTSRYWPWRIADPPDDMTTHSPRHPPASAIITNV